MPPTRFKIEPKSVACSDLSSSPPTTEADTVVSFNKAILGFARPLTVTSPKLSVLLASALATASGDSAVTASGVLVDNSVPGVVIAPA